jgi:small subunit ribosomal protein S20
VNRSNNGAFRASLRRARKSLAGGPEAAKAVLPQTLSSIDKAVQKGLIHKNTAARLKSRLMARTRQATKSPSAS